MKKKVNGFWVENSVYKTKVWCVVKHLPTGILELNYVLPNHGYGYPWSRGDKFHFIGITEHGRRMVLCYHLHPCMRVVSEEDKWSFYSDYYVAQRFFVKHFTPIIFK